jgi:DNA-binding LacI/PurR family transcriptional regulator
MTTIVDVAQRAGVSTATVSRAIRGLPKVSNDARERVRRAVQELGYVTSPQASSLVTGRTRTVGIVVPYVNKWFFGQVVSGVDAVLRASDMDLLLYNLGDLRGRQRFFARMPMRRRVDALIVVSLAPTEAEVQTLRALEIPVALVGASASPFWSVRIDDVDGATRAVQHLLNLGHRRVGMIRGAEEEPMRFTTPVDRMHGYRAALKRAGIAPDPQLEAPADFTLEGGATAMAELLSLAEPPTAVFAQSDEMALGALRTLRRMGRRVPTDISVVGFDDHEMAELFDLTTVAQRAVDQGALVAEELLHVLGDGDQAVPREVLVPTRLIVRGSAGPRRNGAAEV